MRLLPHLRVLCFPVLAVLSACASPPGGPNPAPPLVAASTSETGESPREPPEAYEPAQQDIASLAAGDGLVFVRSEAGCEPWVFSKGGTKIARVGDESLELSFETLVDAAELTVSAPEAKSGPHVLQPSCPDGDSFAATVYVEEDQCETGTDGTPVVGSCAAVLLGEKPRVALIAQLDQKKAEAAATRLADAKARVTALKRALKKSKKVHWLVQKKGEGPTCEAWKVGRSRLTRKSEGGTASYGFGVSVDERLGRAVVSLAGPQWSGPGGESIGIGLWDRKTVTAVEQDSATVGDEQWYFSAKACEAAAAGAASPEPG